MGDIMKTHQVSASAWLVAAIGVAMGALILAGCGGGSGSSGTSTTAGTAASTSSLATVPTTDLSTYDPSQSTSSSSSLSGAPSKSVGVSVTKATSAIDPRAEGRPDRSFCEQNVQKLELFRHAQQMSMPRCFLEAFETAGIIDRFPVGSLAITKFVPPAEKAADRSNICKNIPAERAAERTACESGNEGPGGGPIIARYGIIDGALQIDVCENGAHTNQSTYTVSDGSATMDIVDIRTWQGQDNKASFSGTVSGISSVDNGVVTLSDSGDASVVAAVSGGPGSGNISFDANKTFYTIKGGFSGGFTDPFTSVVTTFVGQAYAKVGADSGCSKFSYTGNPPAMRVKDMIPFEISSPDQLASFLTNFGTQMGIDLTPANYTSINVCPNPDFVPGTSGSDVKPMIVASGSQCASVTNTGVECFSIVNGRETNDFGGTKVVQTGKRVANSTVPYFDVVNAFDVSTISATAGTIAFTRDFDCTGATTTVDMTQVGQDVGQKIETSMKSCNDINEKARDNEGMGGYNCSGGEMANTADQVKDQSPDFGLVGGAYAKTNSGVNPGACQGAQTIAAMPSKIFVNVVNKDDGIYCIPTPDGERGTCTKFKLNGLSVSQDTNGTALSISMGGSSDVNLKLIGLDFLDGDGSTIKSTQAKMTFSSSLGANCNLVYNIEQPSFVPPTTPTASELPDACKTRNITDPTACGAFCSKPDSGCHD